MLLFFYCYIIISPVLAGDEPVNITGTSIWGDTEKKVTYIEGNVRISQGKTLLTTKKAEINLDQKTALLNQGVQLTNPDVIIKAESLEYNLKKKSGAFKNKIVLQQIATKGGAGGERKDPLKLSSGELYFESETKNFTAKDNANIENKDFSGIADTIEYNDKEQKLFFYGNVTITQGKTVLNTDAAEINLGSKLLLFEKHIKLVSEDIIIEAGSLRYDYEIKTGAFNKNVVLNRDSAKTVRNKEAQDPFKLTSDELYFETDTKNFTAQYNGRIEHKDFIGGGNEIEYRDKLQQLIFKDNAYLNRPGGEEIQGGIIAINLRDKNFTIRYNASVSLKVEDDQ